MTGQSDPALPTRMRASRLELAQKIIDRIEAQLQELAEVVARLIEAERRE
jgi:hypothetical protein